jgi:hypothetical protein
LPVDATQRDLAKHAARIKLLAELGQDPQSTAALPLRPPPTLDDIRDAIQRLKDPEKRLIDEFFWFWPQNLGESGSDLAVAALEKGDLKKAAEIWMSRRNDPIEGVVAAHNLALTVQILALDSENRFLEGETDSTPRQKVNEYWKRALSRWDRILNTDELWEMSQSEFVS